ncbi:MAG: PRTRC system ThiF family protein [Oleiphilus sp.]|nr:MAG: PRTRC system ThiF family protein [Oleiphilus sp.]
MSVEIAPDSGIPELVWPNQWRSRRIRVLLVGAGGNGSAVFAGLTKLHFGMQALGCEGLDVTVVDPDSVSPSNLVRQGFWANDVGTNKAITLVHRANMLMGTNWMAIPEPLSASLVKEADLVISCVDNYETRRLIHKQAKDNNSGNREFAPFWLDCGNGQGHGQVVMGHLSNQADRVPHVVDLYPEILKTEDTPDRPSCSAAESLLRQDLCINSRVADNAINLIWQLLRQGKMRYHGVYVDAQNMQDNPIPIRACTH